MERFRKIARVASATSHFTSQGYRTWREAVGNFPMITNMNGPKKGSSKTYARALRELELLNSFIRTKEYTGPLYKGLRGKNAREFLLHKTYSTRTPTSTSSNRNQAVRFTRDPPVILYIPPGPKKALAIHVLSSRPREAEVLLPKTRFNWNGLTMTKNGNYVVKISH